MLFLQTKEAQVEEVIVEGAEAAAQPEQLIETADFLVEFLDYQQAIMEENEALLQADYLFHSTLDEAAEDAGEKKTAFLTRVKAFLGKQLRKLAVMIGRFAAWAGQVVTKISEKIKGAKNVAIPKGTARLVVACAGAGVVCDALETAVVAGVKKSAGYEFTQQAKVDVIFKEMEAAIAGAKKGLADADFSEAANTKSIDEVVEAVKIASKSAKEVEAVAKSTFADFSTDPKDLAEVKKTVSAYQRIMGIWVRGNHQVISCMTAAISHARPGRALENKEAK